MEMNNIHSRGGESHIAQQSLRDKLRVHPQNYNDHNLEQLWLHQGQISDLEQLRNFKYGTTSYDHTVFSSEMSSYATKSSQGLLKQQESFDNSATIGNYLSHQNSSCNFNVLADTYAANPSAIYVGGGTNDACASSLHSSPPNCYGNYQDIAQSSFAECSMIHQNNPKNIAELHCNTINTSPILDYENALQQVVPNEELDMIRYGAKDSNELLHFLPSYGDSNSFSSMPVDQPFRQWNVEGVVNKSRDPRGLSLSLSSLPLNRNCTSTHFSDVSDTRYTKALKCSNYLCSSFRQSSTGSKGFGYRNIYNVAGPHGPFTGYATILKDSKFLKPTLELLDDLCGSSKQMCPDNIDQLGDHFFSVDTNEIIGEGGGPNSASESSWPPYQKKKADLLFLQDEVCRRYNQYQQQMQMVVSSFQSVEGVSAATPYISSAVKTISMHFRCLKDTIADQLNHTGKELGEDLSSPTAAGTRSSTKGEDARNYRKLKSSVSGNRNLFEPPQHIWKPQRGLPERAVSVLRAWLFDHFLHPYPTDTDKHMLAIQTSLTRNQVSNWFINARVRIWKPMVEEIHLLETQSLAEKSSHSHTALDTGRDENHQYHNNQPRTRLYGIESLSDNNVVRNEEYYWNHLQGKLSSGECHNNNNNNNIPVTIEGSLMNILPNCQQQQQQGGFGNVSLTLGLRQHYATSHVQQQMHQQEQNGQHF